jgi:hypothetical protein
MRWLSVAGGNRLGVAGCLGSPRVDAGVEIIGMF